MEIKVGDKVRVSKDAPRIYVGFADVSKTEFIVGIIDDGVASVHLENDEKTHAKIFVIPTKYLTKVEDEAKAKYKVGDKVRVLGHALLEGGVFTITLVEHREKRGWMYRINTHTWYPESDLAPYTEPTTPTIKVGDRVCCYNILHLKGSKKEDYMGYVTSITDIGITMQLDIGGLVLVYHESDLELVQPKEQTEAEEDARIRQMEAELDRVLHPEKYHTYEVTVDNVAMDWQRYEADLAKEIAVKLSKPNENKPGYVADYAVSVAKAVVENLKKK